ncbi:hypothetical protein NECAME_11369 [Necator americanus]|uniref:Uncharacterized protein n=1 Tax=Necator americanus TaxID=51031 RepID=W2T5H9_NECAM|nr:hypothetical protein NECAME_11369 [Necator americanus]ETN76849.1 hypothetical protein NECAME_11369 [Necator americanus]
MVKTSKFEEFCGVNDEDLAVQYLRHCRGDLQAAVQLYFQTDGILSDEGGDERANDIDEVLDFSRNSRNQLTSNDSHSIEASSSRYSVSNARFVNNCINSAPHWSIAQPWHQFIVALLTLPFNFVVTTVFDIMKFFLDLIFGERTPSITNFREDVANFRHLVNEEFGDIHVDFYDGTYDEAFSAACEAETLFAVYLFSPDARVGSL